MVYIDNKDPLFILQYDCKISSYQKRFWKLLLSKHTIKHNYHRKVHYNNIGERERERILSRFHTLYRAQCGAQSHDPEIMTLAEIKSQTLNH